METNELYKQERENWKLKFQQLSSLTFPSWLRKVRLQSLKFAAFGVRIFSFGTKAKVAHATKLLAKQKYLLMRERILAPN